MAKAYRDVLGLYDLYVADLDAIAGGPPAFDLLERLKRLGLSLWVDAGVRTLADARKLAATEVDQVILALESLTAPDELGVIVEALGNRRLAFSLDLKEGKPLGNDQWRVVPEAIVAGAWSAGVKRVIVLDLARVGARSGTGTEALCCRLRDLHPGLELFVGGGIRETQDLTRLRAAGLAGALIASALHDGAITREDVRLFK